MFDLFHDVQLPIFVSLVLEDLFDCNCLAGLLDLGLEMRDELYFIDHAERPHADFLYRNVVVVLSFFIAVGLLLLRGFFAFELVLKRLPNVLVPFSFHIFELLETELGLCAFLLALFVSSRSCEHFTGGLLSVLAEEHRFSMKFKRKSC